MMFIPLVVILVIVALVIIFALTKSHNHRMFSISTVLLWLMAVVSAVPVVWAWKEKAYSENWAMIGVMFLSIPLILAILVLGAVFLIRSRTRKMPRSKTMNLNLSLLGAFLAAQILLIFLTAH
jgi:hypothetical protein